jgi:hypothetical protein
LLEKGREIFYQSTDVGHFFRACRAIFTIAGRNSITFILQSEK